ncbi:MAG: type II toxin-antitoxin system RelE/ParE family toxin [Thermodesulfovibrionales bacterium]|nr:type II toxin-antitoxin system RelE/ParE family toxin [Thermodesulfovibrionales bacterium]
MKFRIEKTFAKDVDNIRDRNALSKLQDFIALLENAESIHSMPHIKKIEGYDSFYRIKIGNYRLGMDVSSKEVVLLRFLHRKDIYRYFPKRG